MKHRKRVAWARLENAAKIFPPTSNNKDTKVFRFTCELFEEVEQEILRQALDETLEIFPLYKTVLRRGLFWYYLESANLIPIVEEESNPVCGRIYNENRRGLLFRVFYYKNRINIEVFHALSDGAGALLFMKTLVYHYLTRKYKEQFQENKPHLDYDSSITQKQDDSFLKHFSGKKTLLNVNHPKAYRIRGTRREENRMQVIEGTMSVKALLDVAHEYNTTMTVYLTALFIYSIYKGMSARGKKNPVVLSVPVNLRQFFESETARNFFSTINVAYHFENSSIEFEDVIQCVSECFKKELTEEKLKEHMNRQTALEHNVFTRVVPLIFKDITLRIADRVNERGITAALSNIGKITMPSELTPYIRQFAVFTSARRPQICICSFGDNLVISFTSPFVDTDIQKSFFQTLTQKGIHIEIATNL